MIILDTNVISELMQPVAERAVVEWLDQQAADSVWTTSISVFEIRLGLTRLVSGARRRRLEKAFDRAISEKLESRVLSFDIEAALSAATIAAERQATGQTLDFRDLEIAGIVASRRAKIATRNVRHFANLGIDVVNPWA